MFVIMSLMGIILISLGATIVGSISSQNRIARIIRQEGITGVVPRKFKATTDSKHNFPVAPNLLNR